VSGWGKRPLSTWTLIALAAGAIGAAGAGASGPVVPDRPSSRADAAASLMARGIRAIATSRTARGLGFSAADVNHTGLIGLAGSPITSSVGVLAAKRTATAPDWAAAVVHLLTEAGVRPGDTVAAGFSGSFPGLNLAVTAAAQSLDLRLLSIAAVSASNWGANDPAFTWLDMEEVLVRAGLAERSLAASLGGAADAGLDLPPGGAALVRSAIDRAGLPLIAAPTLAESVRARMALYAGAAAGEPIAAFINVGGAQANLGGCDEPFLATSGLLSKLPPCPAPRRGVAHHFVASGVPVISLLNVRDLAIRHGLSIDPIPLPRPGASLMPSGPRTLRPLSLLLAMALVFGAVLRWGST